MKKHPVWFACLLFFFSSCQNSSPTPKEALDKFFGDAPPISSQDVPVPPVDCSSFPTNFVLSPDDPSLGICISQPMQTTPIQEFPDEIPTTPPVKVTGVVHGGVLGDLEVRAQNISFGSIISKGISEITYNDITGQFSVDVDLPETGEYIVTASAEDLNFSQVQQTVSIFRTEKPEITFKAPKDGDEVHSKTPFPVQVSLINPLRVGNQLSTQLFLNGVEIPSALTQNVADKSLFEANIDFLGKTNTLKAVFSNSAGSAEHTITLYNDIKGPTITPISLCEPHFKIQGQDPNVVSFKLRVVDDQNETPVFETSINGSSTQNFPCIKDFIAPHQYHCDAPLQKPGVNFFSIIASDSNSNQTELTTSCILAKGISAPYNSNGSLNKDNFISYGSSFAITEGFIQNKVLPYVESFLGSESFRGDFKNFLKQDYPVRGVFPINRGNTSIQIYPNHPDFKLGPIKIDLAMAPSQGNAQSMINLNLDVGAWKGYAGLKTFAVKMYPGTDWPYLDEKCHYPIPLDHNKNEMPFPSNPSELLPNGDCVIDFSPNFAKNFCDHSLNSADPTEENRQCFIKKIDSSTIDFYLNLDHLTAQIPITINEGSFSIGIDPVKVSEQLTVSPKTGFIIADGALSDPDAQLLSIEDYFKQSIVNTIAKTLPFTLNQFLSQRQTLFEGESLQFSVDFPASDLSIVNLDGEQTPDKRAFVKLTPHFSPSDDFLKTFLSNAQYEGDKQGASIPIDPNGYGLLLEKLGSPLFHTLPNISQTDFSSSEEKDLGVMLTEDLINQILFSANLTGMTRIDYSSKFLKDQGLEIPSILAPTLANFLGSGMRRSDGTLIPDETPTIVRLRPNLSAPPTVRILTACELSQIEGLNAEDPITPENCANIQNGFLELGVGDIEASFFEARENGTYVAQPGDDCSSPFLSSCRPLIKMTANALIYAEIKIVPANQTLASTYGLIHSYDTPYALVLKIDSNRSKVRIATLPNTNKDSNRSDRDASRRLEGVLQAALSEKTYNEESLSFENGVSPIEIGIDRDLIEVVDLFLDSETRSPVDSFFSKMGVGSVLLTSPALETETKTGTLRLLTDINFQDLLKITKMKVH